MKTKLILLTTVLAVTCHPKALLAESSPPGNPWSFPLGVQAGSCDVAGRIDMCSSPQPTWHLYAHASYRLKEKWYLIGSFDHFSQFDGKADLTGDEANQSGKFDYYGVGVEYRLGGN